ncbi:MAG TPA: hypothetical protein PLT35_09660, partial [Vicinamibacterales bacterium]|nr:hypothetical protein [Vicinamibacterales bacterium]
MAADETTTTETVIVSQTTDGETTTVVEVVTTKTEAAAADGEDPPTLIEIIEAILDPTPDTEAPLVETEGFTAIDPDVDEEVLPEEAVLADANEPADPAAIGADAGDSADEAVGPEAGDAPPTAAEASGELAAAGA